MRPGRGLDPTKGDMDALGALGDHFGCFLEDFRTIWGGFLVHFSMISTPASGQQKQQQQQQQQQQQLSHTLVTMRSLRYLIHTRVGFHPPLGGGIT